MPIYEYYCEKCEVWFESLGSMSKSQEPATCPECGGPAPRQMTTSFAAFVMRGGYPRGIPDKGQAYGPIGPYTTYATPEQKAKAAALEKNQMAEFSAKERAEKKYKEKWASSKEKAAKSATTPGA